MSLKRAILKSFDVLRDEMKKPKSFMKGEDFEEFILEYLPGKRFELLHQTPEFNKNSKRFNKSAQLPDLKFFDKKEKKEFWAECKYRKSLNSKNQIQAVSAEQLKRHQKIKEPVFYFIGLGGKPTDPEEIFAIPIEEMYTNVFISHAKKFTINLDED